MHSCCIEVGSYWWEAIGGKAIGDITMSAIVVGGNSSATTSPFNYGFLFYHDEQSHQHSHC